MIATTQQGGEIAARAWRGILMNLQMVAGEIDATTGEAINTDDLTKYEKAVNALGSFFKDGERTERLNFVILLKFFWKNCPRHIDS